ncbi:hypothetical protein EVAR_42047_1 [Eumeta japonica]|uniref:Uncharacterized protein n=1 Tax=Eumeta variegata TaxID=151549 RepID=A0A4C1Y9M9_EUMVA|nr:hypothetical protein EVAR_42047_1 [Eumeta japonica]
MAPIPLIHQEYSAEPSGFEPGTEVRLLQGSRSEPRFYRIVAKLHLLMFCFACFHAYEKYSCWLSSRAYSVKAFPRSFGTLYQNQSAIATVSATIILHGHDYIIRTTVRGRLLPAPIRCPGLPTVTPTPTPAWETVRKITDILRRNGSAMEYFVKAVYAGFRRAPEIVLRPLEAFAACLAAPNAHPLRPGVSRKEAGGHQLVTSHKIRAYRDWFTYTKILGDGMSFLPGIN